MEGPCLDEQYFVPMNLEAKGILRAVELCRERVKDWDAFPFTIPSVAGLKRVDLHSKVTFLVGENGSGKSTVIEAIAMQAGLNAEGGTKNFRSANRPSESGLDGYLRLIRGVRRERTAFFLRAETMFNVATEAEAYWPGKVLHEMSHGEAFLSLATERFQANGLYILDEPEAALSPQRQLAFLARLHQLTQTGSQFIVATHSPILMAYPDALIYHLGEAGIEPIQFEDTDHVQITRAVLDNPSGMMSDLLDQD